MFRERLVVAKGVALWASADAVDARSQQANNCVAHHPTQTKSLANGSSRKIVPAHSLHMAWGVFLPPAPEQASCVPRGSVPCLSLIHISDMGTKLYVGNLSYSTTSEQLTEMFHAFGKVMSAQVIEDRMTGRSKGFGFVEMESDAEAQAAISGLNGQMKGCLLYTSPNRCVHSANFGADLGSFPRLRSRATTCAVIRGSAMSLFES